MGSDGVSGLTALHERAGHVIAQDQASCVVYGMPRSVDEAGLSDCSVPIDQMASAILERI